MIQMYTGITTLLLSALSLYILFVRGTISIHQIGIFINLIITTIITAIFFILTCISSKFFIMPRAYSFLHAFSLICLYSNFSILTLFVINFQNFKIDYKKTKTLLIISPTIIINSIILIGAFNDQRISSSFSCNILSEKFRILLFLISFFYISIIAGFLMTNTSSTITRLRKPLLSIIPFIFAPSVLFLLNPTYNLVIIGFSFVELIIISTFLDTSRYIDEESNILNRAGYVLQMNYFLNSHKSFSAFLVHIDSIDFVRHSLGSDSFIEFQTTMCQKLFGRSNPTKFSAHVGVGSYIYIDAHKDRATKQKKHIVNLFKSPWETEHSKVQLTASFCEIFVPEDNADTEMILRTMYRLSSQWKRFETHKVLSFSDLMESNPQRIAEIQRAVRSALLNKGFMLYYQPIFSTKTGKVVSAEALIRLNDTNLGWVSPAEFIPVAEQSGSIHRIGDWVTETACIFLNRLKEEHICLPDVEINLSSIQCMHSDLAQKLSTIARRYAIPPEKLCIEITETASGYSRSQLKKNMDALSAEGFPIAIDDFGTGFSNLLNLLTINFDRVKFDKTLIDTITTTNHEETGLKRLVELFKSLGTLLIAEGVETPEQIVAVKELGIDLIQGYVYSKPLSEDDFIAFVKNEVPACT